MLKSKTAFQVSFGVYWKCGLGGSSSGPNNNWWINTDSWLSQADFSSAVQPFLSPILYTDLAMPSWEQQTENEVRIFNKGSCCRQKRTLSKDDKREGWAMQEGRQEAGPCALPGLTELRTYVNSLNPPQCQVNLLSLWLGPCQVLKVLDQLREDENLFDA